MKKTSYAIKMRDGSELTVEGEVINGRWGIDKRLTQKKTYTANGEEKVSQSSDYILTHVPTGMLITTARTKKALLELINRPRMIDQDDPNVMLKEVAEYWNAKGWKD